jgi:hypothetical protein
MITVSTERVVRVTLGVAALAAALLLCLGGIAAAAAPAPAWKLLAVTGPSNLPIRQSSVQRLTVEAEGGTFTLKHQAEAEATPVVVEMTLGLTEGSATATVEAVSGAGTIESGDRVSKPFEYETTTILSCSSDCRTAGSTIELSAPAAATEAGVVRQIYTKELAVSANDFIPGEEVTHTAIETFPYEYFAPGTKVTATRPGFLTLSNPTSGYDKSELAIEVFTAFDPTQPLPFNASAKEIQDALQAMLGAGSVLVRGGPGGAAPSPYILDFSGAGGSGPLSDVHVSQLVADSTGLIGPAANATIFTTLSGGPGSGEIVVEPTNIGGARTQGLITLRIGPLPSSLRATAKAEGLGWTCPETSPGATIVCTSLAAIPGISPAEAVRLPIEVESLAETTESVKVEISGGGSRSDTFETPIEISSADAPYGTRAFWAGAYDSEGNLETQAGAHPYSAQTFFILNTIRAASGQIVPSGVVSDAEVQLPAGFSGNPLVTERCPQDQVAAENGYPLCNEEMKVGTFGPIVDFLWQGAGPAFSFPIYNNVPARGAAAEFSTKIISPIQSLLASVRSSEDFGVTITAPNIANFYKIFGSYAGLEGEPASAHGKAFLTNPTDCAEEAVHPPVTNLKMEAYELAGLPPTVSTVPIPPVTGCDKLHFTPSFALQPQTIAGSSPTGATADLHVPQESLTDPSQLAQPNLKKAVVTLPEGLQVNPSSANGLASCSEAQMGYEPGKSYPLNPTVFDEAPVTCPDASKIGTFRVKTPLLEEKNEAEQLNGTIYLAAQEANPFHSLIGLYLVVENARYGITLKLPGKVEPDPTTGQLTATFDDNPQVPFEDLTLNFRGGGPRSTLATPEVCGHYATTGSLEPWSAPESGPPAQISEAGFDVTTGCSSSAATRPFSPTLEAGTTGTQAGAYSPLVIKVGRKDGEQELRSLDFTLPKGLLGKLAGIPYCPDASIAAAEAVSGVAEEAAPSCPAASRIGSVDTAAGVGAEPFHVPGSVYLAGPYKGAPLSSVVITPAVAGPFDLGDVVVRAPLYVDPESAQITAKSDPIPTILKGIPLKVRQVSITLDRPDFTLNPTSCDPMSVTAQIAGSNGAAADPANRFQVGGCKSLKFKPKLKLSLQGSTKRTGFPAVKAVLTYPKQGAYANIARAQVNLPHSEFFEQDNLNKICTRPVLLEGKCPKKTIYGKAKAWTPLLDKPLEGPVYVVGGFGYKLPALVADLDGQIRVLLKGKVDSGPNHGIRNTFEAVPDAPVSRFVLELKGGKNYGLLINSENLCKKPQRAIARFTAQNGLVQQTKPLVENQCGKGGGKKKAKHKKGKGHAKGRPGHKQKR